MIGVEDSDKFPFNVNNTKSHGDSKLSKAITMNMSEHSENSISRLCVPFIARYINTFAGTISLFCRFQIIWFLALICQP